jgi:Vault protein inter-alpha-trypsin domain/PEP-CTERM motif
MPERDATTPETKGWRWALALAAGVLLPSVAVAIEHSEGWVGDLVVSPIPTGWHVALLVLVIASNLLGLLATPSIAAHRRFGVVAVLNGVTLGVAGVYTLAFLPLMPLSLLAIVVYGLGFLGFAPAGTFACAVWLRVRLRRMRVQALLDARPTPSSSYRAADSPEPILVDSRMRGTALGVLIGLAALFLLELGPALTHRNLRLANSTDATLAARGVERLRLWSNDDVMVAACHGRRHGGGLSLLLSDGRSLNPDDARAVYYRVHGTRCPARDVESRGTAQFRGFGFDEDLGSDRIGDTSEALTLVASRLDGSIDGDAALGYMEWTLVFRNDDSARAAEARALLALPPGGVISRATLWIDGEEREAAFGGRGAVKRAYRKVVQRRRDPLLVTSAGPDRALVQCFPIPPGGGEMKIRVGISFPLPIEDERRASIAVPRLLARNFSIAGHADAQTLWLESDDPLAVDGVAVERDGDGVVRFRRSGADPDAIVHLSSIRATSDARAIASDTFAGQESAAIVEQWIAPVAVVAPSRVVVAVDTSATLSPHVAALRQALAAIPNGLEAGLVLAADSPRGIAVVEPAPMSEALRDRWQDLLGETDWEGGRDNAPLVGRAWDFAAKREGAIVLWIHAAQPVVLAGAEAIRQRWDRRPEGPAIVHLQVGRGEDVTLAELFDTPKLLAIGRRGAPMDDLSRHFASWTPGATGYERRFQRHASTSAPVSAAGTSSHLVRLWARTESDALRARGETEQATALAVRYQLVTPVSGAVVLESARQYDDADLQPVDPDTVPTVPEPETWAMLILAAAALLLMARQRRWRHA